MKVIFQLFGLGIVLWLSGLTSTTVPAQEVLLVTTLATNLPGSATLGGIAVDGAGNAYIADGWNAVLKVTPAGVASVFVGNPTNIGYANGTGTNALFSSPLDVALDRAGNFYVPDGNHVIRKVTPAGVTSTFAGQGGAGYRDGPKASALFSWPYCVAVDNPGNVFVTDQNYYTIRMIGTNGTVGTLAGSKWNTGYADGIGTNALFNHPQGIAADNAGNVYVADQHNNVIRKLALDSTGTNWVVSTIAGRPGVFGYADGVGTNALFSYPTRITVDNANRLYVTDGNNEMVRKLALDSTGTNWVVCTLAGGGTGGDTDGIGTNAHLYNPTGIAVDNWGKVYVADSGSSPLYWNALRLGVPYPVSVQMVRVIRSAQQVVLSWPASAAGFVLETSATASDAFWTPITTGIVTVGASCFLTNAITSDAAFYRLHHP